MRPPPLEKPLGVERGDRLRIVDGDAIVIEATAASFDVDVPDPVALDAAIAASEHYVGFKDHPFATCFVCGPERRDGDGLRIFPGRVGESRLLAAPWTPTADLADDEGKVRPEFVWAALDCPGGWASIGGLERPSVLGTMAARQLDDVVAGEEYVAVGWPIGSEGRKDFVGSALFTADGRLVGEAAATWIVFKAG